MKLNLTVFGQRVITALFFGAALLIPLFLGPVTGAFILGIMCLFTILEYLQLQGIRNFRLILSTFFAMLMYLLLTGLVLQKGIAPPIHYATYLSVLFTAILSYRLWLKQNPFDFNLHVLPATLYIAVPHALLYALAQWGGNYNPWWLVAILLFVWINDILAYLVGRSLGKHPFSPKISPNKTWEGTLAGWAGCLLLAFILQDRLLPLPLLQCLSLGLLVGITSSVGDLLESLFKRKLGIKDSGTFLPGHGGFLDRLDSILYATPFIALFFIIFIH